MTDNRQRLLGYLIVGFIGYLVLSQNKLDSGDLRFFLLIIPGIILHEVAHGAVANFFGDDTAKNAGRLTLNPMAHIDAFGTVLLPAILIFSGLPPIGYAKPVPVSLNQLRNPRFHGLLVGLAGPFTNLALAGVSVLAVGIMFNAGVSVGWLQLVHDFGLVNVFVAVFNLLPIPPLDGASLIEFLMPRSWAPAYYTFRRYSMYVFIFLFLTGNAFFGRLLSNLNEPAVNAFIKIESCVTVGCGELN